MLRLTLHLVLTAAFTVGPGPKDKMPAGCRNPDGLYEEGRKDFNQKFTKSAIEKFEEAYRCSKNPLILYNIGLSYKRLYDDEKQRDRLEKAKQSLSSYVTAIEQDPSLGADPEEVRPILQEIDAELAKLTAQEPEPEGPVEPLPPTVPPVDPGKKPRLIGVGLMGAGGALTVLGAAVGVAFSLKGKTVRADLDTFYAGFEAAGCRLPPESDLPGANATTCEGLRTERDDLRAKGFMANGLAIGFTVVGAVGIGLLIGGAVAFVKGKRLTDAWKAEQQTRLRVLPSFGGLVLQGNF